MEIVLASGNSHKREEFTTILPAIRILLPSDLNADFSCEETGNSFIENAIQKAEALYASIRRPVLADDSGLCVEALGGAPGIYSARYGESDGELLSAEEKYHLLLEKLQGQKNRSAAFVCALVLYLSPRRVYVFQEECPGLIADQPSGTGGFGYDPVFYLPEPGRTMAELSEAEKNKVSHRGRAGSALRGFLAAEGENLGLV